MDYKHGLRRDAADVQRTHSFSHHTCRTCSVLRGSWQ